MSIKRMTLKNFRAVDSAEFVFGNVTRISGTNGAGKSTVYDAFCFLAFGKAANGSADMNQFKPIRNGDVLRDVETSVTIEFDSLTLTRTLKENWVKTRGTSDVSFKGNTVLYEVDDVPVKKGEFEKIITEMYGSIDAFKILSDPAYVAGMNWKDRRAVVAKNSGLDTISTIEAEVVSAKATLKKVKELGKELPARIDEVHSTIDTSFVPVEDGAAEAAEVAVNELQEKRDKLLSDFAKGDSSKITAALNDELNALHSSKSTLIRDHRAKVNDAADLLKRELGRAKQELAISQDNRCNARDTVDRLKAKIKNKEAEISVLQAEYVEKRDEVFSGTATCQSCNRDFDGSDLEEIKSEFNQGKAKVLADIVASAEVLKSEVVAIEKDITLWAEKSLDGDDSELSSKIEMLETEYAQKDITSTANTAAIDAEIDEVEEKLQASLSKTTDKHADTTAIDAEIVAAKAEMQDIFNAIATGKRQQEAVDRIKKLKSDKLVCGKNQIAAENSIDDLNAKILSEIEAQEAGLNDQYSLVSWKLFELQLNGGVNQVCTPMIDGVEYSSLNRAMQFAAGIDIINTLSKRMDNDAPIWVDNAEAYVALPNTDAQVILLEVNASYLDLAVEILDN